MSVMTGEVADRTARLRAPILAKATALPFPAWSTFAILGLVLGLLVTHWSIEPSRMRLVASLPFLPLVLVTGAVTARIWWRVAHQLRWWRIEDGGLCIQGGLLGGLTVAVAGVWAIGDPPRYFLDAVVPGLFVGLAVARVGCLAGGCCAGRPSRSRWALWSYSGSVGGRRVPTQPLESLLCLGIAALALTGQPAAGSGALFVAAMAAYALGRQALWPLRDRRRPPSTRRPAAFVASTAALTGALVAIATT